MTECFLDGLEMGALRSIQESIGSANRAKGFRTEGDELRSDASADWADARDHGNLRNYYSMKLGLIVTEAAEAIEELRSGVPVNRTYYNEDENPEWSPGDPPVKPAKPEGVPSELADIVIRAFDFADEAGIDLAAIIDEKLAYNVTRPFMHGKKA